MSGEVERLAENFGVYEPIDTDNERIKGLRIYHTKINQRLAENDSMCFFGVQGANMFGVSLDMRLDEIEKRASNLRQTAILCRPTAIV